MTRPMGTHLQNGSQIYHNFGLIHLIHKRVRRTIRIVYSGELTLHTDLAPTLSCPKCSQPPEILKFDKVLKAGYRGRRLTAPLRGHGRQRRGAASQSAVTKRSRRQHGASVGRASPVEPERSGGTDVLAGGGRDEHGR